MNFNHKLYFSILDRTLKGIGKDVYEAWINVVEDIENFKDLSYTNMDSADQSVWILFRDALDDAGESERDNPLLEVAESLLITMGIEEFVIFYFHCQVASLVAEGQSLQEARDDVHGWFDEDDNRWFRYTFEDENDDEIEVAVYFNRDETVTDEPKDEDSAEMTDIDKPLKRKKTL